MARGRLSLSDKFLIRFWLYRMKDANSSFGSRAQWQAPLSKRFVVASDACWETPSHSGCEENVVIPTRRRMAVANYAGLAASRRCGNGLREEAAGTRGVANHQIHFCQPQGLFQIGARSKPVFGGGGGEGLRVARKQFAIPLRSQLTPVTEFAVTPRLGAQ